MYIFFDAPNASERIVSVTHGVIQEVDSLPCVYSPKYCIYAFP
jgi:hypothetical protein